MESKHLILISVLVFVGCGGGGSSSPAPQASTPAPPPIPAPASVSAKATSDGLVVDWAAVEGASDYNLYYATEKGLDIANYAAYQNGTLIPNIQPPQTVDLSVPLGVYQIIITANMDSREGQPTEAIQGFARFKVSDSDPSLILDAKYKRQWDRCPYGMTYEPASNTCSGTAQRMNVEEAKSIALAESKDIPGFVHYQMLSICESGEPGYFMYDNEGECEGGKTTLYHAAFPATETETPIFMTNTKCSFSDDYPGYFIATVWPEGSYSENCTQSDAGTSINLRLTDSTL
ncbi:hypothetical protein [Alcanivorax jadensis]|uniref:hypothetical protein n=1 Tax=Alcanivorax jadensis TaxID=64988 RepID=UPI0035663B2B